MGKSVDKERSDHPWLLAEAERQLKEREFLYKFDDDDEDADNDGGGKKKEKEKVEKEKKANELVAATPLDAASLRAPPLPMRLRPLAPKCRIIS